MGDDPKLMHNGDLLDRHIVLQSFSDMYYLCSRKKKTISAYTCVCIKCLTMPADFISILGLIKPTLIHTEGKLTDHHNTHSQKQFIVRSS